MEDDTPAEIDRSRWEVDKRTRPYPIAGGSRVRFDDSEMDYYALLDLGFSPSIDMLKNIDVFENVGGE